MENFIKKEIDGNKFELLIDTNIFSKEVVMKASYNFLDRWYFFFKIDENQNIILQFSKKDWEMDSEEKIIWEFSDELLSVSLRINLELENKFIREAIVWAAILNSVDSANFVELNTDRQEQNQIDFDKDIDEILREIENDPELKIDEAEIERILREIEEETTDKEESITLNPNAIKDVKTKFQDR